MRFIAMVEEAPIIERILAHIGTWEQQLPFCAPPTDDDWPEDDQIPLMYGSLPDIA